MIPAPHPGLVAYGDWRTYLEIRWAVQMSQDIAARPDLGPYEVGLMQELFERVNEISGERDRREQEEIRRRFRGSGRAVDIPPKSPWPFVALAWPKATVRVPAREPHTHWAFGEPGEERGPALSDERWAQFQETVRKVRGVTVVPGE